MTVSKTLVLDTLRRVKGPDLTDNIVDLGLVSEVLIKDARVYFSITVPAEKAQELEPLRRAAQKVVEEIDGVAGATAVLTAEAPRGTAGAQSPNGSPTAPAPVARNGAAPAPQPKAAAGVPGVKHLVAVASGKGGVGKSTTAVNLALGFLANGLKAGVLDADIYGPSQPRLLGLSGQPQPMPNGNGLRPMEGYGLKAMSMGFLIDEGTPVVWRGPMLVSALNQMLRDVAWNIDGDLDVLVIDMPPGTGDVQLSMAQQVPLSGAVIVSTPQDLALIDARKGLNMFRKVDVPVLGIIENMSYFICTKCGERHEIFGHGGAANEAEKLGLPFLGGIPLDIEIRERSDAGQPITATEPDSIHAQTYRDLAARVWGEVEAAQGKRTPPPKLTLTGDNTMLNVSFDDGRTYDLPAEMLRVMSPSAEVQGHSPDQRVTVSGKRNVKISKLEPTGNYATKIFFDDGHSTGLFAWTYLDTLGREKGERWAAYEAELAAKGMSRG
ncbi:MAG: P-loop NTPase [Hyphomicrobiaceae bacterium]|nr:P-loop NTPase [Hyphomicrobiaceae bacterium]MCC0010839.1 P-loop NTPase [Hyphomicrobiaceae bacterium]